MKTNLKYENEKIGEVWKGREGIDRKYDAGSEERSTKEIKSYMKLVLKDIKMVEKERTRAYRMEKYLGAELPHYKYTIKSGQKEDFEKVKEKMKSECSKKIDSHHYERYNRWRTGFYTSILLGAPFVIINPIAGLIACGAGHAANFVSNVAYDLRKEKAYKKNNLLRELEIK